MSGRLGGRGGAGGRGGGRSLLTCGVTGAAAGGEVVRAEVVGTGGVVVVGLGCGRTGGRTAPPVGSGDSGAPSVGAGAAAVSSVGGVEAPLGSSSGEGGEGGGVGGASAARGGPEGEKVGESQDGLFFPLIFSSTIQKQLPSEMKHIPAAAPGDATHDQLCRIHPPPPPVPSSISLTQRKCNFPLRAAAIGRFDLCDCACALWKTEPRRLLRGEKKNTRTHRAIM